jgi:glyoxylate/hydroxypyruvate reductase A
MTISIICTNKNPLPWVEALKQVDASLDVQIWPNEHNKEEVEFALCWKQPEGVLRDYPNLKCICSMGAGIDHLLDDPFFPKNIPVVRIIDPNLAQSMFEYIGAVIMRHFRDLDVYQKQQRDLIWQQQPPKMMSNTTIGMMGLGQLGGYAAVKLSKMGFNLIGWSSSPKYIEGVTAYVGNEQLDRFLSQADILVCLLPLTAQTQAILNLENMKKLPKGAFLVNVARGDHLVDEDLLIALQEGHISGACLDVFREEPLPKSHPFWSEDSVLMTPHSSSITNPISVAPQIVHNYRLMKSGQALLNQVDLQRGY